MQKIFIHKFLKLAVLVLATCITFAACEKDKDGRPDDNKPGGMTSGTITPGEAAGGTVLTLKGSGIGDIRSILFEKGNVPAPFTSTLNTESALIFSVPDTAFGGDQNIVFTNSQGKTLSVPFNVIALPQISGVSNYNFVEGYQITLTGFHLEEVNKVVLSGTTTEATIVSKSRKELVIEMPATDLTRTKLDVTNATGTTTTTQEFISIDNNFVVYADSYGPGTYNMGGIQNWSYGLDGLSEVTDVVKTGTKALKVDYNDGGLSLFLGCNWSTPNLTFTDALPDRKFLTFWARAVDADVTVKIVPDAPWGGNEMWGDPTGGGSYTFNVPKNTWTYFKIPANTFTGSYSRINFGISGTTKKTVYFDDILWVK